MVWQGAAQVPSVTAAGHGIREAREANAEEAREEWKSPPVQELKSSLMSGSQWQPVAGWLATWDCRALHTGTTAWRGAWTGLPGVARRVRHQAMPGSMQ